MVASQRAHVFLFWLLCASFFSLTTPGAEPNTGAGKVAKPSSISPAQLLGALSLKPGFRIQVVAAEPMVAAPVAIAFDENGRLFVVERRDGSSAGQEVGAHWGRVRMLENPDKDGVYQTSTIYADNLFWPSAVACYSGGVFVAALPDIVYFRDTRSDGVADIKQVVLSGFGGTNQPSPNALPNSFAWGLDDRIHGVAGTDGLIVASNWPAGPVSLTGSDFSLEPRTLQITPEAGPAQSGLAFDSRGRRYVSDFSHPLRLAMYEFRYAVRNPFYAKPAELLDVLSPATPVYHLVPYTGQQVFNRSGLAMPQLRQGTNLLEPGWLVSARGCTIYRGGAFPTNYLETAFVADPGLHVVHHALLREDGLQMVAERASDEANREFLLSSDPSFHPVQIVNGPDGALYVVDAQDANERGRIYRITPQSFKTSKPPQLGKAKTYDLVRTLAEGDGWHRDTAARLIYERRDMSAVPLLATILNRSRSPLGRLYALHSLDGLDALQEAHVLRALSDSDAFVREHGVLLSERLAKEGIVSDTLWNQLASLAGDPAARVRYQLAFTLGAIQRADRVVVLQQLLNRDLADPWIRNAVLSSLADKAGSMFALLAGDARFRNNALGLAFLRQLATMLGTQGRADDVAQVINFIASDQLSPGQAFALLYALGDGLHRTKSSLALVDPQQKLQRWYTAAFNASLDLASIDPTRVEALRLLGFSPYKFSDLSDWLLLICSPPPNPVIQSAAIETLGRYDDSLVVQGLLDRWQGLTAALRNRAITALLSKDSRVPAILDAIARGRIPLSDLTASQLNFLRTYHDPALSARAVQLFGPVPMRRPAVTAQFRDALRFQGVAERGRQIFRARCLDCHQIGGEGQSVGPDLAGARAGGKEKILTAVLEPNLEVAPEYATWILQTKQGENLIGIKVDDDLPTITLRQPGGVQLVWPRLNLSSARSPNWSLMPDGLEQGLAPQDMADLIEYVMTAPK